jgi:LytR cell envelope-related transcriptional attenuator
VQHVQPLDRPFPWRAAALAATALALAELAALLALAGIRLVQGHHSSSPPAATSTPAARHTPTPKTVVHALRPRSHVAVLVLNGNGIAHAAGTEAAKLLSRGYRRATASDASQHYVSSLVLFRPGWEREAHRLAHDAGIRTVAPLDGTLSPSYGRYPLVLILGAN